MVVYAFFGFCFTNIIDNSTKQNFRVGHRIISPPTVFHSRGLLERNQLGIFWANASPMKQCCLAFSVFQLNVMFVHDLPQISCFEMPPCQPETLSLK